MGVEGKQRKILDYRLLGNHQVWDADLVDAMAKAGFLQRTNALPVGGKWQSPDIAKEVCVFRLVPHAHRRKQFGENDIVYNGLVARQKVVQGIGNSAFCITPAEKGNPDGGIH